MNNKSWSNIKKVVLLLALSTIQGGQTTEIDNFLPYTKGEMQDSLQTLNKVTVQGLERARRMANLGSGKKGKTCSDQKLYRAIWKTLGGDLWGKLENKIVHSKQFDKVSPKRGESIYRNFKIWESFPLYMVKLGSTIRVGDHMLGADKFGHFFAEGHVYFLKAFYGKMPGNVDAGMKYGEKTERGIFGLKTTGVYSYADLTANYNGMIFWSRVTKNRGTVAAHFDTPAYFVCDESGQWQWNHSFDWREYIDPAWDETVNCGQFRNKKMQDKVNKGIAALVRKGQKAGRRNLSFESLQCPRSSSDCYKAMQKYGPLSERLVNPLCREKALEYKKYSTIL